MMCAITQPTYLPWAGGFDLMDHVDVFAHYDDVQIVKRTWDVRNRIRTASGELYLTIPIKKTRSRDETVFNNAVIDDSRPWRREHLDALVRSYRKARFFEEVFAFVEPLITADLSLLADFNINCITAIARKLGIQTSAVRVSSLPESSGKKDARLVGICRTLAADTYLSPLGAHEYIEQHNTGGAFEGSGIRLVYQHYVPVSYTQLHGEFRSHMCILDLLFNEGFDSSLRIIRAGRRPMLTSSDLRRGPAL